MKRSLALIALTVILLAAATAAEGPRKVALVIGNSDYPQGRLLNPVNDANDMAAALKNLGFAVTLKTNANRKTMREAIDDFGAGLGDSDIALFYYSGHGVQLSGENYLVPVSADVKLPDDLPDEAVPLNRLLSRMGAHKGGTNIVILDACRNNPFPSASRGMERGLAVVGTKPPESLIVYSTEAGSTADDGEGRNGAFTGTLLGHIAEDKPFADILMEVNAEVQRKTSNVQKPAQYQNLTRVVRLNGEGGMLAEGQDGAAGEAPQRAERQVPSGSKPQTTSIAMAIKKSREKGLEKGINQISASYMLGNPSGLVIDGKYALTGWLFADGTILAGHFHKYDADRQKYVDVDPAFGGALIGGGLNLCLWGWFRPAIGLMLGFVNSGIAGAADASLNAMVFGHWGLSCRILGIVGSQLPYSGGGIALGVCYKF